MIVALDPPDFRTISDFRKRHLKALGALFLQVLKLCETAGLVKLGDVALDGTKIKANASKHKAMSYQRMKKREAELKAEVARMWRPPRRRIEEDETFGQDKRGDEMPDWTGDKQKRLAKIQQAMAALEADARLAAEEERRSRPKKKSSVKPKAARSRANRRRRHRPTGSQVATQLHRSGKRIMKSKDGFVQAYKAQAAVDAGAQIIVAHELTQCGNDQGQLVPLIEAIENNLAANRSRPQPTPATAAKPISKRSKHTVSTVTSRPDAPSTRQSERKNRRTADPTDAKEDRRWRLRNALPRESKWWNRCSDRSNRHAASASSCCGASRKCAPNGPSSAPSTTS